MFAITYLFLLRNFPSSLLFFWDNCTNERQTLVTSPPLDWWSHYRTLPYRIIQLQSMISYSIRNETLSPQALRHWEWNFISSMIHPYSSRLVLSEQELDRNVFLLIIRTRLIGIAHSEGVTKHSYFTHLHTISRAIQVQTSFAILSNAYIFESAHLDYWPVPSLSTI